MDSQVTLDKWAHEVHLEMMDVLAHLVHLVLLVHLVHQLMLLPSDKIGVDGSPDLRDLTHFWVMILKPNHHACLRNLLQMANKIQMKKMLLKFSLKLSKPLRLSATHTVPKMLLQEHAKTWLCHTLN